MVQASTLASTAALIESILVALLEASDEREQGAEGSDI